MPRNDSLKKFSGRDGIAFHGLTFSGTAAGIDSSCDGVVLYPCQSKIKPKPQVPTQREFLCDFCKWELLLMSIRLK